MFKKLTGIKQAVKGGFSTVAEHGSQLAEQVVSDPSTSKSNLKENLKKTVKGVGGQLGDVSENVLSKDPGSSKEKAAEVVHNIKHYGGFGEEYLGYSDPTKDLRKAVKEKEKAAKKARKAKKKKTGKKGEDLFDPENLAKYKKELEEKRRAAEEAAATTHDEDTDKEQDKEDEEEKGAEAAAAKDSDSDFDFETSRPNQLTLDAAQKGEGARSKPVSTAVTPKEDTEDWKNFLSLTSGVDHLIKKTQDELQEIKQESYFQKKETKLEDNTSAALEAKKKEKKKKWVDLDEEGFEDFDGEVLDSEEEAERVRTEAARKKLEAENGGEEEPDFAVQAADQEQDKQEEGREEEKDKPLVFKTPSIESLDSDDDLFNTDFVNAVTTGEVKLAVIPDDPKYDDDDDPFNTQIADVVVKKQQEEKKKEEIKLKFTGLSAVADVLAGKSDKLDKSVVESTVKRKRRRANRINLIGEDTNEVTAVEDIANTLVAGDKAEDTQVDILTETTGALDVPEGDLLSTTPTSGGPTPIVEVKLTSDENKTGGLLDFSEFEEGIGGEDKVDLTSNVAILAGEFAEPVVQTEEDDFDAAFDALAQESVTKTRLEELEKEFENDDIFDTTCADKVLNLASLIDKVEEKPAVQENLDDAFDDPFDTSAYDHITGEVETELDFEAIASREVRDLSATSDVKAVEDAGDAWGENTVTTKGDDWAAFGPKKPPPRPAPPKPAPKRPPPINRLKPVDPKDNPAVVVKAPSTESIKSWNCATAESLIRKSVACEDDVLEEEEEFDPFDTAAFEDKVEDPFDTRAFEEEKKESEDDEDVDPFDTSAVKEIIKESEELEKARQPVDLLAGDESVDGDTLVPVSKDLTNPEVDPFDTDFAKEVLPDKGDPFDTSHVKGELGKSEIEALEEEFLDKDVFEFDPRVQEGTAAAKRNLPGVAARARPKRAGTGELVIKAQSVDEPEEEEDPFDTSIVDKVIPVKRAAKPKEVSLEDDEFDPTATFQKSKELQQSTSIVEEKEEVDPFDTGIAASVLPEGQLAPPPSKKSIAKEDSIDSDDFDPRA